MRACELRVLVEVITSKSITLVKSVTLSVDVPNHIVAEKGMALKEVVAELVQEVVAQLEEL